MDEHRTPFARRSFLKKAGAGMAAIGVASGAQASLLAQAPTARSAGQPARHEQDDWMDQVPGRHRFFFDTATPKGFGEGLFFASNFFTANRTGYGLTNADLAVVICARHQSTPFAYSDAMWAKYGAPLAERATFTDPRSSNAPTSNPFDWTGYGAALPNSGLRVSAAIDLGVHFAVCGMSTRAYAGSVARATGGDANAIYEELARNLVTNGHLVPAGIVAVNRAQERGYTFAAMG